MRRRVALVALALVALAAMPASAQRGRGGRSEPPPSGQRRGGPPPPRSSTAHRIEQRSYLFTPTNETIEYDVFVSTKVNKEKKSPLVIGLHGLGTPPRTWLGRITDAAESAGYIVAAPMGYTVTGWYGANGPGRPVAGSSVGAFSEQDVMNVLDLMKKEFNVDERRIYLAGHSMGGAGALFLGIKHKDVWAAVSASAPAIRTALHAPAELEHAKDLPFILIHGDADTSVPILWTRQWAAKMKELQMTYEYREIKGGTHSSTLEAGAPFTFKFFDKHVK